MAIPKVLSIILAGGEGKRLMPLTEDRAKPAVPFGGHYRLIDFALSNVVNSGYLRIIVLTQYKSHSLDRHISTTWHMSSILGNYIAPVPAQQRTGKHWYMGSADAIFQSVNIIRDEMPDYVLIIGADNIYRMDFGQMVQAHIESGLPATVAGIRQPLSLASSFGVIEADASRKITAFKEKPLDAVGLPDAPDQVLASMGNYVFNTDALLEALAQDAIHEESAHDMGGNIVPYFVSRGQAGCYDFINNIIPRPRLLARRGYLGCLLRGLDGSDCGAPHLQSLQSAMANPHRYRRPYAPGKIRLRRRRPHGLRRGLLCLQRGDYFGRKVRAFFAFPRRAAQFLVRSHRFGVDGRSHHRSPRPHRQMHHR